VRSKQSPSRWSLPACALAALALWPATAAAQVREVVVGVTPNCPYGIKACWAGAYEALGRMEGVRSVATTPDAYNCTATVRLKGKGMPDPKKWANQFKSIVDQAHVFRGVEVTVEGALEKTDDGLVVRVPGIDAPLRLAPLRHKLQWNFKKRAARQPEPDEKDAHEALAAASKVARDESVKVSVTGPLIKKGDRYTLEVREFTHQKPRE
jgi:hypothetical protein